MNQIVVQKEIPIKDSMPFDYKTSITGELENNNRRKKVEIAVPLKHLSNFGEHWIYH